MDYWRHHRSGGYASVYRLGIGGFTDSDLFSLGCPEEWRREKLSRISVPKAQISHHLCVRHEWCVVGYVRTILSPHLVSNPTSAWAAGNSLVFGEYILLAANVLVEPTRWTLRLVGFACITFAFLIHGVALRWGLRLQEFSRSWYSFSS